MKMPFDYAELPCIALTGGMGAGKSTTAELLSRAVGYTRLAFAANVREVAVKLYGPDAANDRDVLQRVGHGLRQVDEEVWVRPLVATVDQIRAASDELGAVAPRLVVDDVRYPNEVEALRERGFLFLHVNASRNTRLARVQANGKLTDEAQMEDVTEHSLPNDYFPDYFLHNGDGHDLESQVMRIVNRVAR